MKKEEVYLKSSSDGLKLFTSYFIPKTKPKGIVQFSHGMDEYQDYYYDMMKYFTNKGYITVINDHRGHGKSVKTDDDLGYFYDETSKYVVDDLHDVTKFIKEKYKNIPVYLFGHSMGSLIARSYIKKYDNEIDKLIVCGSPGDIPVPNIQYAVLKIIKKIKGDRYRSKIINSMALTDEPAEKWLSINKEYVKEYKNDYKCQFIFTINGFMNLVNLVKDIYHDKNLKAGNKDMDILFIAGSDDIILEGTKNFHKGINILKNAGYKNVDYIMYDGFKHAIFKDDEKKICKDVLEFIEDGG